MVALIAVPLAYVRYLQSIGAARPVWGASSAADPLAGGPFILSGIGVGLFGAFGLLLGENLVPYFALSFGALAVALLAGGIGCVVTARPAVHTSRVLSILVLVLMGASLVLARVVEVTFHRALPAQIRRIRR